MKIRVMSDLHLEFQEELMDIPFLGEDVLVLAGDIISGANSVRFDRYKEWFRDLLDTRHVIYVAGNHEYYDAKMESVDAVLEEMSKELTLTCPHDLYYGSSISYNSNACLLKHNGKNYAFYFSTLWSESPESEALCKLIKESINDYNLIFTENGLLTLQDTQRMFLQDRADILLWLAESNDVDIKKVVITHHSPSFKSVPEKYKGSKLNYAFSSNLESIMYNVDLWIHGHTHTSFDYHLNGCRVVCNPYGYNGIETNPEFDPALIIEI